MLKCKGKQSRASYGVPVPNRIWRSYPCRTTPTLNLRHETNCSLTVTQSPFYITVSNINSILDVILITVQYYAAHKTRPT